MTTGKAIAALMLILLPLTTAGSVLDPLPCGIYDEMVRPLVERDLDTQSTDASRYTMETVTRKSRMLSVEVKNVLIMMPGERHQVLVLLDGKPFVKTSHQDVPLYLEVHIDSEKYRIICVRVDEALKSEQTGTQQNAGR
jgi:hypothetical protein